ncbi:Tetratricopeptide repeat protein 16 [Phytophthora citrophthora]|uniref:Tetratricopeptide repeat protein 16 n=1 Tax=Phytophthora citrophthora TaxID=4793 RepID=A0AAD9GIX5_9STRA|nr:Tetratricopeptide repeat protein 16 [Phytophthora citrophthora]
MVASSPSKSASATTDLTPLEASRLKEEEADALIAARDFDGALQCLTKAIFLRPEHAQLYAKRAQVYWELCDIKSAIANYRKLFAVEPDPPQRIKDQLAALLDLHAYSLLSLGESPTVVLGYLNEAIQLNALNEAYWLHRAVANIEAGSFEKAVEDVGHCICLNSRDVEYFVLRAKLHWRLHIQEKATADIHKAAQLQPDHPEVLGHEQRLLKESQAIYEQARTQLMAQQFQDAIQKLSRATDITPEETKLYLLRASAYRELGEYHMALRDTEKALTCHRLKRDSIQSQQQHQNPTHVPALCLGSERDTSPQYRDIIKQRSLILNDIGVRFLSQKSYQLAVNAMNQAIRSQMELGELSREQFASPQHFLNRGDAYRGLGNFQAALADYHHALELLPGDQHIQSRVALVHYQFGVQLFNKAQFDKAELEFSSAIEHDSNVPSYYVRRGDAARYLEKHQAACEDYQQALRLSPSDTDTLTKLQQYNVTPLPAFNSQRTSKSVTLLRTRSPQQRRSQELQTNVDDARRSFKKTNQRVQELFQARPMVPPPSMNTLK